MIGKYINILCCEDPSLIENYELAINDDAMTVYPWGYTKDDNKWKTYTSKECNINKNTNI